MCTCVCIYIYVHLLTVLASRHVADKAAISKSFACGSVCRFEQLFGLVRRLLFFIEVQQHEGVIVTAVKKILVIK